MLEKIFETPKNSGDKRRIRDNVIASVRSFSENPGRLNSMIFGIAKNAITSSKTITNKNHAVSAPRNSFRFSADRSNKNGMIAVDAVNKSINNIRHPESGIVNIQRAGCSKSPRQKSVPEKTQNIRENAEPRKPESRVVDVRYLAIEYPRKPLHHRNVILVFLNQKIHPDCVRGWILWFSKFIICCPNSSFRR